MLCLSPLLLHKGENVLFSALRMVTRLVVVARSLFTMGRPRGQASLHYSILVAVVCVFAYGCGALADTSSGGFVVPTKGLHYLMKYSCSRGDCAYKLRFRLNKPWAGTDVSPSSAQSVLRVSSPAVINLRVFLDEEWDAPPIRGRLTCDAVHHSRAKLITLLPLGGSWSGKDKN